MQHQQLEIPVDFDSSDVEIISKRTLFNGFFKLDEYTFKHRLFAGGWSGEISREVFERGNAAALLAYDPRLDQVVLIEQIRIPAIATSNQPWLLELIAGMVDKAGEDPREVVKREAQEEAGITLGRCQHIMNFLISPGGTTEAVDLYVGEVDATLAHGVHGLASEGEDIRVHVVTRDAAYRMVQRGRINNAATVIGIQWLQLNYLDLRTTWQ